MKRKTKGNTMTGREHGSEGKRNAWLVAAAALALAAGCAEPEKEKLPQVTTQGPHAVEVGGTIQIVPMTANGSDTSYTFTTANAALAAVDDMGRVTGVAPGETSITVTGAGTKAKVAHAVVVVPRGSLPDGGLPDGGVPDGGASTVPTAQVPYFQAWLGSAHADRTAPAFTNWNKDGMVPTTCARCHSSEGFIDYLGGDNSVPGRVDKPAPIESVVRCETCHNPAANTLSEVTFPSGAKEVGLGGEARCMTCHQGRASGADVDKIIAAAFPTPTPAVDDMASPMINFTNIHYYPAAATLYAGRAKGGYQYTGQVYDTRFRHVEGYNTCIGCHEPHSAKPKLNECATCHAGVKELTDLRNIRMMSSASRDYDGDGNLTEGVYFELQGLKEKLLASIVRYGVEKNAPICYGDHTYPYWFKDTDGDGECGMAEETSANAYKSWTPRLARAAFNFQMASKDPGAFAHNAKYIMELLFDSATDLNSTLVVKVDMARAVRGDQGHFDGSSTAARRWDSEGEVSPSCSRCHSGERGFKFYMQHGVSIEVPETANGLECGTCHSNYDDTFAVHDFKSTSFPGGTVSMLPGNDNLCSNCHAGRTGKKDIDAAIASNQLHFLNVHYLPGAATRQGTAAKVGYEYDGLTYAGPLKHMGGTQCTSCHDPVSSKHSFHIRDAWEARCKNCHADANGDPNKIRQVHLLDYDGDGSVTESLAAELAGLGDRLLATMATVTAASGGICYDEHTNPYFFKDADGDKKPACSAAEAVTAGRFTAWTPALMKAAHNYQMVHKDPGSWAHNFDYSAQLLHDSIANLGGVVATLKRP